MASIKVSSVAVMIALFSWVVIELPLVSASAANVTVAASPQTRCPITVEQYPIPTYGPTLTTYTSTVTKFESLDCGPCTALVVEYAGHVWAPEIAVNYTATITASHAATLTSLVCISKAPYIAATTLKGETTRTTKTATLTTYTIQSPPNLSFTAFPTFPSNAGPGPVCISGLTCPSGIPPPILRDSNIRVNDPHSISAGRNAKPSSLKYRKSDAGYSNWKKAGNQVNDQNPRSDSYDHTDANYVSTCSKMDREIECQTALSHPHQRSPDFGWVANSYTMQADEPAPLSKSIKRVPLEAAMVMNE